VLDIAAVPVPKLATTALHAEPLPRIRLAEPFERLRDASDRMLAATGARPTVFLANLGTPADYTGRASFAENFFAAGGIEARTGDGIVELQGLGAAFKASGAVIACLCSTDEVYAREAVSAATSLTAAGAKHVYLAGRPRDPAAYSAAGIGTLIFAGCNALATLRAAHDILGVR